MNKLDKAKKKSEQIENDIKEMLLNMSSHYDIYLNSVEVSFSGRSLMVGSSNEVTMSIGIRLNCKFDLKE